MNIAILASGSGSNFEAIAKAAKKGYFKATIKLLISDKEKAFARKRAEKFKIKNHAYNQFNGGNFIWSQFLSG